MSIEIKYKLGDLAKDLGAASKDIIEMLSALEKGEAKKHTTPLAESELNLVLEQMTNNAQEENFNAYFAMAAAAKKKEEKKNNILEKSNILLNCRADNSDEAIVAMGKLLQGAGYIDEGYIQGMLNRDHSLTTYIGNDIAIPHGEYEVKDCVKKTGIAVMIYPDGIRWADGRVRIVIGIAAKNDDHMAILANIAEKLGEMEMVEKVVAGDVDTVYEILAGDAA